MKASELMIGDWVSDKYGYLMQVTFVGNGYASFEDDEGNLCQLDDKCNQPEPIPLAPEILEKNGFSSETFLTSEWEKEVYFKEFPGCVVEPDNSGKYIFGTTIYWNKTDSNGSPIDWGTMYDSRIYNLQYVHELQHALRICGFNELADNFKI